MGDRADLAERPWRRPPFETFEELRDFIESQMSMSHVYQPLLIRALIDADGAATLRQIATTFVANDETVLREAERLIRRKLIPRMNRRGVIAFDKDTRLLRLMGPELSFEQKARLRAICEARLGEYMGRRGYGIWDHRLLDDHVPPHSMRYEVLAESERRCALCGATQKERPLHVDHIVPYSRGGSNEKANLQVLCSRCNSAKCDRDTRDYRVDEIENDSSCPFCQPEFLNEAVARNVRAFAAPDSHPVTEGHTLVITRRHTPDFLTMTQAERQDADGLLRLLIRRLKKADRSIQGFNVGANCGHAAGQTIPHAHLHLIPRRRDDVKRSVGGMRRVIPPQRKPKAT